MEADFGEEPDQSSVELLALRDILEDALDGLTPIERDVVNGVVVEQVSLRTLARRHGRSKSGIAKVRDRALSRLRDVLAASAEVKGHLGGRL